MINVDFTIGGEDVNIRHDGLQWCIGEEVSIDKRSGGILYGKLHYYRSAEGAAKYLVGVGLKGIEATEFADIAPAVALIELKVKEVIEVLGNGKTDRAHA